MNDNLKALIDKLPPFNPEWSQDMRIAWFTAYVALCRAAIREDAA